MVQRRHVRTSFTLLANIVALCLSGGAIGWMVGMSVTPVVQKVLESVLGVSVAAVATLAGIQELSFRPQASGEPEQAEGADEKVPPLAPTRRETRIRVNAVPLAAFSVFLALFATLGLRAKISDTFAVDPETFVDRWRESTGLDGRVLAKMLLESEYPALPKAELRSEIAAQIPKWAAGDKRQRHQLELALLSIAYERESAQEKPSSEESGSDAKPGAKTKPPKIETNASVLHAENSGFKSSTSSAAGNACQLIATASYSVPFKLEVQVKNAFPSEVATCPSSEAETSCATEILHRKCPTVGKLQSNY